MQNPIHVVARHPRVTLALVHATGEIRPIVTGSYESQYDCGEVISLALSGRDGDAEVFCDECALREGLKW
jgi:hypothetical protein